VLAVKKALLEPPGSGSAKGLVLASGLVLAVEKDFSAASYYFGLGKGYV